MSIRSRYQAKIRLPAAVNSHYSLLNVCYSDLRQKIVQCARFTPINCSFLKTILRHCTLLFWAFRGILLTRRKKKEHLSYSRKNAKTQIHRYRFPRSHFRHSVCILYKSSSLSLRSTALLFLLLLCILPSSSLYLSLLSFTQTHTHTVSPEMCPLL